MTIYPIQGRGESWHEMGDEMGDALDGVWKCRSAYNACLWTGGRNQSTRSKPSKHNIISTIVLGVVTRYFNLIFKKTPHNLAPRLIYSTHQVGVLIPYAVSRIVSKPDIALVEFISHDTYTPI